MCKPVRERCPAADEATDSNPLSREPGDQLTTGVKGNLKNRSSMFSVVVQCPAMKRPVPRECDSARCEVHH